MAYAALHPQIGGQMSLKKELGWSAGLHLMLLLAGVIYLPPPSKLLTTDHPLPVDIVSVEEFTRLTRPAEPEPVPQDVVPQEQAKVQPKVEAKPEAQPQPPAAPPTPAPIAAPVENPADIMPALEATPNLATTAQPVPRPQPPPSILRPQRKPLLDTGRVLALLDKTPSRTPPPLPQEPSQAVAKLSINEIDRLRIQIRQCWRVPAGALAADDLIVRIRVGLHPDGSISNGPYVVNRARLGDRYFRAAAESVLRAIRRCQPFQMPAAKYQNWRELELNFDPSKMLN
ncbi:MAG: cell envelope integrity protein TolA [Alphaproteobacteria bacterium]|nr:cell envelope integrity protein TolA [Alphaproteobacteria bacterium]